MQNNNYKDFCKEVYNNTFNSTFQDLCQKHKSQPTEKIKKDFETPKNWEIFFQLHRLALMS